MYVAAMLGEHCPSPSCLCVMRFDDECIVAHFNGYVKSLPKHLPMNSRVLKLLFVAVSS